jgi:hypothetical protein
MTENNTEMNAELLEYLNERAENMKKYSERIKTALGEIDSIVSQVMNRANLYFADTELVYKRASTYHGDTEYRLVVRRNTSEVDGGLWVEVNDPEDPSPEMVYEQMSELPKVIQKNIVRRLPKFVKLYADFVEKTSEDYHEAADLAEKMLAAIQPVESPENPVEPQGSTE